MTTSAESSKTCHYIPGVIATAVENSSQAQEMLDGQEPMGIDQLAELMGGEFNEQVLNDILQIVAVFPFDVETGLERLRGVVPASAVHGLGNLNHLSSMPGTEAQPFGPPHTEPNIAPASPGRVVAVIDSGVTTDVPEWLETGLHDGTEREVLDQSEPASHGTFVAGLIRRIAPEHCIMEVIAERRPIQSFVPDHAPRGAQFSLTSELDVLAAMIRLLDVLKMRRKPIVEALNLSLGGVSCFPDDPAMITLTRALDLWRRAYPTAPIFAAGGNRDDTRAVYPGAFEYVRAVAAAEDGGELVVWEEGAGMRPPIPAPARPWITDAAPGSALHGPSGKDATDWVEWSGSSFATAVATACYVTRRPSQVKDGVTWWPDASVRYADLPGLIVT